MVADTFVFIKTRALPYLGQFLIPAIIAAVAFVAFGLGRLSALDEKIVPISTQATIEQPALPLPNTGEHTFVATKSGSKFYPAGCAAAAHLKASSEVWFTTAKEAEAAGYELSAKCNH